MNQGRKSEFEKQLRRLIEAGSMEEAERLIRGLAAEAGTDDIASALDRPLSSMRIEDWISVGADMEEAKRRLAPEDEGKEWRAAFAGLLNRTGLDALRVRISFGLDAEPQKHEPRQLGFMSDADFEEYRREVEARTFLPEGRRYRAEHRSDGLRLIGLDDLWELERASMAGGSTPAERDLQASRQALAAAAILLRFHQLVERHAADPGLPRALPLFAYVETITGPTEPGELDFGTQATRLLRAICDRFDHAAAARIVEQRAAERALSYLTGTRRIICELREKQEALALWPFWLNPGRRLLFRGFVRQDRNIVRQAMARMHGIDAARARGEALARIVAEARHPGEAEKGLEPLAPDDRTDLHKLAIAFAGRFGGKKLRERFEGYPPPPPGLVDSFPLR